MKIAFALLLPDAIHNFMRSLTVQIHNRYRLGYSAASAPSHISLKQPFHVDSLDAIETYFDNFAASIVPFSVTLSHLEMQIAPDVDGNERGILWLAVAENPTLRALHCRINRELATRFENTAASFDGDNYRFHATLFAGGAPIEIYRQAFAAFKNTAVNLTCTAARITMFYKEADNLNGHDLITYKILPLGGK